MILDTNALSAFAESDERLVAKLQTIPRHHLPSVVLGEYRFGVIRSRHRKQIEPWLDELENQFLVLEIDSGTARFYATIREQLRAIGKPIPVNDLWIAALALQHQQPIISRDTHFDLVAGVTRIEW